MLLYPHSFTGGSSNVNKKPRGRPFLVDEYGNMTDKAVTRDQERDAAREKEIERKRKAAARKPVVVCSLLISMAI